MSTSPLSVHDQPSEPTRGSTYTNAVKDPDNWTTGGENMTAAQASYLKTLSEETGEEFDAVLTKGEAAKRIDDLQDETGRGKDH